MISMRRTLIVLLVLGILASLSFTARKDKNPLLGVWVFSQSDPNGAVYSRQQLFDDNKAGLHFKSNGVLRVRQNTSFCGTPPVDYETVRGSWKMMNDSVVALEYPFWGGHMSRKVQVMKLTQDQWILVDLDRQ